MPSIAPRLRFALLLAGLITFALWFLWPLLSEEYRFSHPEYVNYYFGYRNYFLQEVLRGHFPLWNPYWGIGHTNEIEASIPLDIYSLLEIVFGPHYLAYQVVQLVALLLAIFWSLRALGAGWLPALACALFFFFSPWPNYYFYYFLKTNSFLAFILGLPLAMRWFQTENRSSLLAFIAVNAVSLFGTKLEFWFYQYAAFGLLGACAWFLGEASKKRVALYYVGLALSLGCHLWQIVPIVQTLQATSRLIPGTGLGQLFSSELYDKLWLSVTTSGFLRALGISLVWFPVLRLAHWRQRVALFIAVPLTLLLLPSEFSPLRYSGNRFVWGGIIGMTLGGLAFRGNATRLGEAFLYFLPLSLYWLRDGVGDLREVVFFYLATSSFQILSGALVALGCFQISRLPFARIAYVLFLALFLCRDQGQVLMAYLSGTIWMPTRDNYLFDFCLTLIAAGGLGWTLRNYWLAPVVALAALLLLQPPAGADYHESIVASYPGYTAQYEGENDYRQILRKLKDGPTWRGYFVDGYDSLIMYSPSITERANHIGRFSSLPDRRYKEWVTYHNLGIFPEKNWDTYPPEYTKRTLALLPRKNTLGYPSDFVYWNLIPQHLNLDPYALRMLGVKHLISRKPLSVSPDWSRSRREGGFFVSELRNPLPRAFLLSQGKSELLTEMEPILTDLDLEPVILRDYQPEQVEVSFEAKQDSVFVLTDLFHPFWKVELNGKQAKAFPVFGIFRGVEVKRGTHHLSFRCVIPGFSLAVVLSALAWAFLLWQNFSYEKSLLPILRGIPLWLRHGASRDGGTWRGRRDRRQPAE